MAAQGFSLTEDYLARATVAESVYPAPSGPESADMLADDMDGELNTVYTLDLFQRAADGMASAVERLMDPTDTDRLPDPWDAVVQRVSRSVIQVISTDETATILTPYALNPRGKSSGTGFLIGKGKVKHP